MSDLSQFDLYSEKVKERLTSPKFQGKLTEEDAQKLGGKLVKGEHISESCGDGEILYWVIDENEKILDAKFESFGCGTSLASTDMMVELSIGKTVDEATKITNVEVEHALRDTPDTPAFPSEKMSCSITAYDVLLKTAATHKGIDVNELKDKDIVCQCANISRGAIIRAIRKGNLQSIDQVKEATTAGTFCGKCIEAKGDDRVYYIKNILNEELERKKSEEIAKKLNAENFDDMTFLKKMKTVDTMITTVINPQLAMDGGAIELMDVKENEGVVEVYINYLGACSSCSSSGTTTLYGIESALRTELKSEKIKVIANNSFSNDFANMEAFDGIQ